MVAILPQPQCVNRFGLLIMPKPDFKYFLQINRKFSDRRDLPKYRGTSRNFNHIVRFFLQYMVSQCRGNSKSVPRRLSNVSAVSRDLKPTICSYMFLMATLLRNEYRSDTFCSTQLMFGYNNVCDNNDINYDNSHNDDEDTADGKKG